MLKEVVIVGAARTAIGDYLGSLKDVSAIDLGITAVKGALSEANLAPEQMQEVVCGTIYKAGLKGNPGRQIQLHTGMPPEGYACTIDQQCGSAMRAFQILSHQIMLGNTHAGVAVGIESMSNAAYILPKARAGYRMGNTELLDSMLHDGLIDAIENYHMGVTAENLAEKYQISRQEQDELACLSHYKAIQAIDSGKFKDEIIPVIIKSKKGDMQFDTDEHPRRDISIDKLSVLKPAFKKDGTVTAGNASGVNDGAAALILTSKERAKEYGLKPLAKVVATANYGVLPKMMGIGPAYAIPTVLEMAGLKLSDIGYFEINEAFAAQFIAVNRELKLDMEKVNVNGSGIALGHPVGCSGARIIVSLIYEMIRRGEKYGVASLCVGGGPALAVVLENMQL